MHGEYQRLEAEWRLSGYVQPGGNGVGINGGEVSVCNVGSSRHLDYTVLADQVNVATRRAGAERPGQVLVSAETIREITPPARIELMPLGEVTVKGTDEPIPIYEARTVAAMPA